MPNSDIIDFSTIVREEVERAFVVTIPLQAVVDFLRGAEPSVIMVDGVAMDYRYAKEVMLEVQNYFIKYDDDETRAALKAQALEPKF